MRELWRPVTGYEGIYSVSSLGRVRREAAYRSTKSGRILHPFYGNGGYLRVRLSKSNKVVNYFVHVLVMLAFVGPAKGLLTRHLDGNPENNRLGNLRYGTPVDNYEDSRLHGTNARGERQGAAKLRDNDVQTIRALTKSLTQEEVAEIYGVSRAAISSVCTRRTFKHIN